MEGFRGNLLVTLNESLLYRSHELQFTYYKSRSFSACLIYGLWDLYTRQCDYITEEQLEIKPVDTHGKYVTRSRDTEPTLNKCKIKCRYKLI